jgi:hypothetical protein
MIYEMDKARAGMKADAGFDRVESLPAAEAIQFGLVVGEDAQGRAVPGGGTRIAGISLHTHTKMGGYEQYDDVSIETNAPVWAQVIDAGTVTDGGDVEFDAAGRVQDADVGTALPNAIFRSDAITLSDGSVIALVQLANPFK